MSGEDPGLLGSLPRSRPGRRSEKRAEAPRDAAAKPPPRAAGAGPPKPEVGAREPDAGGDPVGEALRTAGRAAGAGLRVANDVTRGILRRLPRP